MLRAALFGAYSTHSYSAKSIRRQTRKHKKIKHHEKWGEHSPFSFSLTSPVSPQPAGLALVCRNHMQDHRYFRGNIYSTLARARIQGKRAKVSKCAFEHLRRVTTQQDLNQAPTMEYYQVNSAIQLNPPFRYVRSLPTKRLVSRISPRAALIWRISEEGVASIVHAQHACRDLLGLVERFTLYLPFCSWRNLFVLQVGRSSLSLRLANYSGFSCFLHPRCHHGWAPFLGASSMSLGPPYW